MAIIKQNKSMQLKNAHFCPITKEHVCCTKIENLSVKSGNEIILKDVNLHLHCGELTAIVGRNGAGKSTLLKALLGEIKHSGTITFEGERCASNCEQDKSIDHDLKCSCRTKETYLTTRPRFGYVPQKLEIEEGNPISVEDFVLSCVSKRPVFLWRRKKDIQLVKEILSVTSTQNLAKRKISDLSGGELQRVVLATAIHPVPDILLLDEPVSGVDRQGLKEFYKLVSSLRRDYDTTILLVSHDLDLVAKHADRVILVDKGIAASGKPKDVYSTEIFKNTFGQIVINQNQEEVE